MTEDFAAQEHQARMRILEAAWASLTAKEAFWQKVQAGGRFQEDRAVRTLACLGRYFTDRGRGILTLGVAGFDWEAEIVLRTVYECAVKIMLLALVDEAERGELLEEFWDLVPEASDRKTARKAASAEAVLPQGAAARDVFRLMQDERVLRNSRGLTKSERRRIEGKWSFAEIIERLAQFEFGGSKMWEVRSLLHIYGMASHLTHADHAAMDLMFDRALRPVEELAILRVGHIARIATDMSSLGAFCAHLSAPLAEIGRDALVEIDNANSGLFEIASEYTTLFEDDQRAFYDRMFGRDGEPPPAAL